MRDRYVPQITPSVACGDTLPASGRAMAYEPTLPFDLILSPSKDEVAVRCLPKTTTSEPDELRQAQGEVFGERKPIKSVSGSPAAGGEGSGAQP
jgi:hypothetical protein